MRGRSSPNPPAPCNGFTIASLLLYVGGLPAVLQYLTVISQLGHIVDDDDATCDALNRGVYQYVEVKEYRMLLSQRREMPQLLPPLDRVRRRVLSFLRCAEIAQLVERWPSKP